MSDLIEKLEALTGPSREVTLRDILERNQIRRDRHYPSNKRRRLIALLRAKEARDEE